MKVQQHESKTERKILIAMIVDKEAVSRIAPKWDHKNGLFKNPWSNMIAGWCVRHFNQYSEPIGKHIETKFERWAEKGEKDTVALVERFLNSLSGEFESLSEGINSKLIIDLAGEYFSEVKALKLAQEIKEKVSNGNIGEAISQIHSFDKVEMGNGEAIDVFADKEAVRRAFEEKKEPLIVYPGALGRFFSDAFERDSFISFESPDKRGKSFWLMDVVWRAVMQRRKTAYFILGDMSESQVMRRFLARACRRPLGATSRDRPVRYPLSIFKGEEDKYCRVETEDRHFKKPMGWQTAWKTLEKISKEKIKSNSSMLKLSCHPAATLSMLGIRSILDTWERREWSPDVVVVDYADNLAAIDGRIETIHQINMTWQALSTLRQEKHCCVVTATQTKADAYKSDLLNISHFSGNKLKRAHVTGTIGINQSSAEKEQDITRLNWIVLREAEYVSTRVVHVAGCRPIANIACRSTF